MKISVIYPTRNRPKVFCSTLNKWQSMAQQNYYIEWIISADNDDSSLQEMAYYFNSNYSYFLQQGKEENMVFLTSNNLSAIQAINEGAKRATGDILVVISDDFSCFPQWDTVLIKEIEGKSDFVLKTQDGIQKTCVTLPIMDRIFYERYGYVYHPGFRHMWADVDLTAVAAMTGKLIFSDLMFEHLHYSTGKAEKDLLNERNNNTWRFGENFLKQRIARNFDIENPVMKYEDIIWK